MPPNRKPQQAASDCRRERLLKDCTASLARNYWRSKLSEVSIRSLVAWDRPQPAVSGDVERHVVGQLAWKVGPTRAPTGIVAQQGAVEGRQQAKQAPVKSIGDRRRSGRPTCWWQRQSLRFRLRAALGTGRIVEFMAQYSPVGTTTASTNSLASAAKASTACRRPRRAATSSVRAQADGERVCRCARQCGVRPRTKVRRTPSVEVRPGSGASAMR